MTSPPVSGTLALVPQDKVAATADLEHSSTVTTTDDHAEDEKSGPAVETAHEAKPNPVALHGTATTENATSTRLPPDTAAQTVESQPEPPAQHPATTPILAQLALDGPTAAQPFHPDF